MEKGRFSRTWFGIAICALAALLASCRSEQIRGSSGTRPAWVKGLPQATSEHIYAVGQALGENVLDEPTMRDRAMADAREQLARRLATRVESRGREVLQRHRSGSAGTAAAAEEAYYRELRTRASQRLHGVTRRDSYWEKWRVDPGPFHGAYVRYKYYVLAAYPRGEYERIIRIYERLAEDRKKALTLLKAGKPRRAASLLEEVLDETEEPPAAVRLTLARAYEQAGLLERAEAVLRAAMETAE